VKQDAMQDSATKKGYRKKNLYSDFSII